MKEFIEKLIGRLEEKRSKYEELADGSNFDGWAQEEKKYLAKEKECENIIEIVNQLAEEYINCSTNTSSGWIPASEPPKCFMLSDGRLIPFLVCDKLMWHPYIAFYNGKEWFTALEKLNPTAYMPLPPAYVPEERSV